MNTTERESIRALEALRDEYAKAEFGIRFDAICERAIAKLRAEQPPAVSPPDWHQIRKAPPRMCVDCGTRLLGSVEESRGWCDLCSGSHRAPAADVAMPVRAYEHLDDTGRFMRSVYEDHVPDTDGWTAYPLVRRADALAAIAANESKHVATLERAVRKAWRNAREQAQPVVCEAFCTATSTRPVGMSVDDWPDRLPADVRCARCGCRRDQHEVKT